MPPTPDESRTVATLEAMPPAAPGPVAPPDWYDRSSLPGDFMVMIAGQTEEDYLRRAPEKQFCEFIDGIVYMPPRVHPYHQEDVSFLLILLNLYHSVRPTGYLASGPVGLRLREDCWVEPDLFLVPEDARARVREEGFGFPPVLLVIEVLSPSNRAYDLEIKAREYRAALVDEIWFVDRPNRVVIVERRDGATYTTERVATGSIVSRSLPGFWFDVAWLWAGLGSNILECLNLVLAGPPSA